MLSERAGAAPSARPVEVPRAGAGALDWGVAALSCWFVGGLVLDGWAHSHGKVDSSFFTPWHAVFYSGFAAVALLLGAGVARGVLRGEHWSRALPDGYLLALVGAPLFALGGVGDLIWHTLFGIERGIDALLSPTHLLLAVSMGMIVSAPLRAAWRREGGGRMPVPALMSLGLTWTVATFMTEFCHPFVYVLARDVRYGEVGAALGVTSIVIQAALMVGALLLALRRWSLPPGGLLALLVANAAAMSVFEDRHWVIAVAAAAGLAGEALLALLRPSPSRPRALAAFAGALPAALELAYFYGASRTGTIYWTTHLWLGSVVAAAVAGVLLSTLVGRTPAR